MNGQDTYKVRDHAFSIIPSVSFEIEITEHMDESWYRGTVHIGYKVQCMSLQLHFGM